MPLKEKTKEEIKALINSFVSKVNKRRFEDEPWVQEQELVNSPFNVRLVPDTIWKASKYERSFVTGFGTIYEDLG